MAIPRNEDEARRFVDDALAPWRDNLITTAKGAPKALLHNAIVAFRQAPEWAGKLQFDAFYQRTMLIGQAPWAAHPENRVWMPTDDLQATSWLQSQGILIGDETANKAIELVSRDLSFHPVVDYLKTIEWDGTPRIDTWLIVYLGCADTAYIRSVSSRFLISAIARVMQPGCKADCALILEGRQGSRKSTAIKILFSPWYTDEISELGSKDAAMQMAGVWGIEMAELEGVNRADTSRIKAALSRSIDRYRPPWGRRIIDQPRQCVFCGTVNHNEYLRDETGGRRFWPCICGRIDTDQLAQDRDQLWAEARERFFAGSTWWLENQEMTDSATLEQAARRPKDPWEDSIEEWAYTKGSVTPTEYLRFIGIEDKDMEQREANRVSFVLRALGYERISIRDPASAPPRWRYKLEKLEM